MFTYPLTLADAIQAFVKYTQTHADQVEFDDPVLNQLYADEAQGLCTITFKTINFFDAKVHHSDSILEIVYTDPELEFVRKLQC